VDYMLWIKSLPCSVESCDTGLRSEAAHVGDRAGFRKCSDFETIPLCGAGLDKYGKWRTDDHHREGKESVHKLGRTFWEHHGLNRDELIARLNKCWELLTGEEIGE
jgi:hypothetical protein